MPIKSTEFWHRRRELRRWAGALPAQARTVIVLLVTLLATTVSTSTCGAQAVEPREALADAKAYFTAPLRWDSQDWLAFGGALASIGLARGFDDNVRDHFVGDDPGALDGNDSNSGQDALPAAVLVAGTWLLAGALDDPGGWRELGSMLEASAFTLVTGEVMKYSFGRVRPNETTDADQWFKGGDSFPSMHSGLAFAIGTVFAESGGERYRWLRRIVGYGVGGATAYARVEHNAHWTSDVVAGAALGWATARFTMHRREGIIATSSAMILPVHGGGLLLTFAVPLH